MAVKQNRQQPPSPYLAFHRRACLLSVSYPAALCHKTIRTSISLSLLPLPKLTEIVCSVEKLEEVAVGFLFCVRKGEGDGELQDASSSVCF